MISGYEGSKPRQVLVSEGELSPRVLERLDSRHEDLSPSRSPLERAPAQSRSESSNSCRRWRLSPEATTCSRSKTLEDARNRQGIDIETPAERTKIRPKYLRALENEDWEGLPWARVRARGFIRAYADEVGIDSEVLVDEYRRRHEAPTGTYEHAEPVLRGGGERAAATASAASDPWSDRRRGRNPAADPRADRGRRRRRRAAARALPRSASATRRAATTGKVAGDKQGGGGGKQGGAALPKDATMKLVIRSDLQACVVDGGGRVLRLTSFHGRDSPRTAPTWRGGSSSSTPPTRGSWSTASPPGPPILQ